MALPYLRSIVLPLAIACAVGLVMIVALTAGSYSWHLFAIAGLVGGVVGIPIGLWNVRRMRAIRPLYRPASPATGQGAAARELDARRAKPYPSAHGQGRA